MRAIRLIEVRSLLRLPTACCNLPEGTLVSKVVFHDGGQRATAASSPSWLAPEPSRSTRQPRDSNHHHLHKTSDFSSEFECSSTACMHRDFQRTRIRPLCNYIRVLKKIHEVCRAAAADRAGQPSHGRSSEMRAMAARRATTPRQQLGGSLRSLWFVLVLFLCGGQRREYQCPSGIGVPVVMGVQVGIDVTALLPDDGTIDSAPPSASHEGMRDDGLVTIEIGVPGTPLLTDPFMISLGPQAQDPTGDPTGIQPMAGTNKNTHTDLRRPLTTHDCHREPPSTGAHHHLANNDERPSSTDRRMTTIPYHTADPVQYSLVLTSHSFGDSRLSGGASRRAQLHRRSCIPTLRNLPCHPGRRRTKRRRRRRRRRRRHLTTSLASIKCGELRRYLFDKVADAQWEFSTAQLRRTMGIEGYRDPVEGFGNVRRREHAACTVRVREEATKVRQEADRKRLQGAAGDPNRVLLLLDSLAAAYRMLESSARAELDESRRDNGRLRRKVEALERRLGPSQVSDKGRQGDGNDGHDGGGGDVGGGRGGGGGGADERGGNGSAGRERRIRDTPRFDARSFTYAQYIDHARRGVPFVLTGLDRAGYPWSTSWTLRRLAEVCPREVGMTLKRHTVGSKAWAKMEDARLKVNFQALYVAYNEAAEAKAAGWGDGEWVGGWDGRVGAGEDMRELNGVLRSLYLHDQPLSLFCEPILDEFIVPKWFGADLLYARDDGPDGDSDGDSDGDGGSHGHANGSSSGTGRGGLSGGGGASAGSRPTKPRSLPRRLWRLNILNESWPSVFVGGPGTSTGLHSDFLDLPFWLATIQGKKHFAIADRDEATLGALHRSPKFHNRFAASLLNSTADTNTGAFESALFVDHWAGTIGPGRWWGCNVTVFF